MLWLFSGCLSFLVICLFDIVSLKRLSVIKPFMWTLGNGLLIFALVMIILDEDKLPLPIWSAWLGWVILTTSLFLLIYSLFVNLPFRRTYISTDISDELITTGLYALVRHPGVTWFIPFMFSLLLISKSNLLLLATPVFILLDIALVIVEEKFIFARMFDDYNAYKQETPMLLPNRRSIGAFLNSLKQPKPKLLREG